MPELAQFDAAKSSIWTGALRQLHNRKPPDGSFCSAGAVLWPVCRNCGAELAPARI